MKKGMFFMAAASLLLAAGCKKEEESTETPAPSGPNLVFKFAFDPTQERLDNFGNPSTVPTGHAAQSPIFKGISAHYLELATSMFTPLSGGEVLYVGSEKTSGGATAIDFSQATVVDEGDVFMSIPLSSVAAGSYEFMRVSLSFQKYDIQIRNSGVDLTGTLASFIGYNTYISNYTINTQSVAVNDDKLQGYWGFEMAIPGFGAYTTTGQAPPGATTVPNPIFATSAIPQGSCVVTGEFLSPLQITGNETEDIVITLSLSTNNSFEWIEVVEDAKYEPAQGEQVVDMGIRGLIPYID